MNTDPVQQRRQGGFPTERPTEALKKDHQFVRQLFDRYLNTQDGSVKKEAGTQILTALELHTSVEEMVFYPRVHALDAGLVDQCEEEHQQARQLMDQLKRMDAGDPQCDQLFRQLATAILHHIDIEERQLFPKVEQANLDLTAIGLEMQAVEASIVSGQAQSSAGRGMRH